MPNSSVILSLAKVLVAAAWADGIISNSEMNSLKDLLFHLPGMTASDWAQIDIYLDSPVGEAERQRLTAEFEELLKTPADKELALHAFDSLIQADGNAGEAELEVIEQLKSEIGQVHTGSMGRFIRSRSKSRSEALQSAPNRELAMEDFTKNKIFYDVNRKLEEGGGGSPVSDALLRKLSLAGGLLARIAYSDEAVSEAENATIQQALQEHWSISADEAHVVAEAAEANIRNDLDYYRLTRMFYECTTELERVAFLDVLFAIATSESGASYAEIEDIRAISKGLLLTHEQFIAAKLKTPAELREQ